MDENHQCRADEDSKQSLNETSAVMKGNSANDSARLGAVVNKTPP